AAKKAIDYCISIQSKDGHWCAELESNATITSEYVFLQHALGLDLSKKKNAICRYFFGNQKADGSWGIASNHPGDLSTTAECYLALRLLGISTNDERLKKAEHYILAQGGLERVRIFTRINFAMFGLWPWSAIPVIPPEFIFLPPKSPVNIYSLSSWARGTMVPLFMIFHHKPIFALPNGRSASNDWLDHLWRNPTQKNIPYTDPLVEILRKHGTGWKSFFSASDVFLRTYERYKPRWLRAFAIKKCEEWVLERQEKTGDWAGIFPPMYNGVLALYLHGYSLDSKEVKGGLEAIERFAIEDEQGFRVQACVSPVWDTVLTMIGMIDCGHDGKDEKLLRAREWIKQRQLLVDYGDWKVYNPKLRSGGWAFEYENSWYPDVDDTAAVIIGLLKQDRDFSKSLTVQRAVEWTVGMQNRDGGWAAFDINNDKIFLNEIPFSDMDSLCDPSSPDVTGRVLEALGILGGRKFEKNIKRGVEYLRKTQEKEGSWFGRWGVNYVYGTSNVLCALSRLKNVRANDPMIVRALDWLKSVQNADGGWGECLESYSNKALMGKGQSTASQTAWAVMGLLAYLPATDESIRKGIEWLITRQKSNGNWDEEEFTGTGFPNHFYLRYHLYRQFFPMMAIGRFLQRASNA
ncbi:MAG TPA: squalene--hopene cyclase, partial [Oligoflexia bacterium]|nr:squalene--hopene cyclase [Oligoflexia bacterium]